MRDRALIRARSCSDVCLLARRGRGAVLTGALLISLLAFPLAAAAADWKSVTPASSAGRTQIMVDSKTLSYHRATDETPVRFVVEGPTRVKVLTRLRVPTSVTTMDYAVHVACDGAPLTVENMSTESAGPAATYLALEMFSPGKIRRFYLDVPTGRHAYDLTAGPRTTVDLRVFEAVDRVPQRVSLAPRSYAGVETLLARDNELTYYLATETEPVVLEVSGPTTIKVNARLVFDMEMRGEHSYMIGIRSWGGASSETPGGDSSGGGAETIYRLESKASTTLTCRDRGDVLPGALRTFDLPVAEGQHTFVFRLAGGQGREVALKFYIPGGDVANGS